MRPTYDAVVTIFESHPQIAAAQREAGVTAAQAAAGLIRRLDTLQPREADAHFSKVMAAAGVFTSGIEAFNRGTEEMLEQLESRGTFGARVAKLSEQSRSTPVFVSPERISFVTEKLQQGRLQQGLSDRLRARDAQQAKHETPALAPNPRVQSGRDDDRDRRSAIAAALGSAPDFGHVRIAEQENLRDSVAASFDAHVTLASDADPLEDEGLRAMSNAV